MSLYKISFKTTKRSFKTSVTVPWSSKVTESDPVTLHLDTLRLYPLKFIFNISVSNYKL